MFLLDHELVLINQCVRCLGYLDLSRLWDLCLVRKWNGRCVINRYAKIVKNNYMSLIKSYTDNQCLFGTSLSFNLDSVVFLGARAVAQVR